MRIIELDKNVAVEGPTSLALGFFDGIHIGHRKILEKARDIGLEKGFKSGILTFKAHPLEVLKPGIHFPYLTTIDEREKIIESIGLDYFLILPFTTEIAGISPGSFIEEMLVKKLDVRAIVVGKDYHFGKNAAGNVAMLKEKLQPKGVEIHVIKDISIDNHRIGSTNIRNAIKSGSISDANRGLGRWYSLEGLVQAGKGRGSKMGIPTANLDFPHNKVLPPRGVYCVLVLYKNRIYRGVGSLGDRPTFNEYHPNIEVHLLNFNGKIYGKKIRVFFIRRRRDILKFSSVEELTKNINEDIAACENFFLELSRAEMERNFACCPELAEGSIVWKKDEFMYM